jgi:1-acyl-sn-glycerol-3-phosphate acyltransferase
MRHGSVVNWFKRSMIHGVGLSVRAWHRLFLDVRVSGRDRVPPGPKIYACNHISSLDGFHVLPFLARPIHCILGPGYQSPFVARLLDAFEQIDALRLDQRQLVERAVCYLDRGESIIIAPEGDVQEQPQLGRFFPAVAKIYRISRAPIIPIAIAAPKDRLREWPRFKTVVDGRVYRMVVVHRGPYCIRFGAPWQPEIDQRSEARWTVRVTRSLRDRVASLREEIHSHESWAGP